MVWYGKALSSLVFGRIINKTARSRFSIQNNDSGIHLLPSNNVFNSILVIVSTTQITNCKHDHITSSIMTKVLEVKVRQIPFIGNYRGENKVPEQI